MAERDTPEVAKVDRLVAEQGYTIPVPDDTSLRVATEVEQATGGTGPANWWRLGLLALFVVVAILFVMQWMGGNRQTAVIPDTPVTAPANQVSP